MIWIDMIYMFSTFFLQCSVTPGSIKGDWYLHLKNHYNCTLMEMNRYTVLVFENFIYIYFDICSANYHFICLYYCIILVDWYWENHSSLCSTFSIFCTYWNCQTLLLISFYFLLPNESGFEFHQYQVTRNNCT